MTGDAAATPLLRFSGVIALGGVAGAASDSSELDSPESSVLILVGLSSLSFLLDCSVLGELFNDAA